MSEHSGEVCWVCPECKSAIATISIIGKTDVYSSVDIDGNYETHDYGDADEEIIYCPKCQEVLGRDNYYSVEEKLNPTRIFIL